MKGKKEFILERLDCPNCSAKIQEAVCNLQGVKEANVNLLTQTLFIETDKEEEMERVEREATKIIMNLEPHVKVKEKNIKKLNSIDNEEQKETKKQWIQILLAAVLFLIGFLTEENRFISLPLYVASYIVIGKEVVIKALKNITKGQVFDENFLMTIATFGAFFIKEYPEAVAVMFFYQIGEIFQDFAVNRSRKSIKSLLDIRPDYANLKINGKIEKVDPDDVTIGNLVLVRPGEKVPLDGIVVEGEAVLDTSMLTGESLPRRVSYDDEVLSGMINTNGIITLKVTKGFEESTASKILELVQNASGKKAPTENFITKFARYYTPVVVIGALLLAFIPPIFLKDATLGEWFYRALVFLVISCPCALVVSIPLSFFGGIGAASKKGILVKGGNYLEALNYIDTVVFDKTGTLTKGVFEVIEIHEDNDFSKEEVLEYAALAEVHSSHPIAKSIIKKYEKTIDSRMIDSYEEIAGLGIKAKIKNNEVLVGNHRLMEQEDIIYHRKEEIGTLLYVSINRKFAGSIVISDEVKEDALSTIEKLREIGIQNIAMLTGDYKKIAENIAKKLKIEEVYSELLPAQKVEKIEMLESKKNKDKKIVFVGDGMNDAPVLTRADIGIAMGGLGSDAAIEAADIVLMTDEPSKLIIAIKIAKKTKSIVWQNIIFALGVKGFFLLLGAFGIATMWEAVFADVGVALIAVLNAMRAGKVK